VIPAIVWTWLMFILEKSTQFKLHLEYIYGKFRITLASYSRKTIFPIFHVPRLGWRHICGNANYTLNIKFSLKCIIFIIKLAICYDIHSWLFSHKQIFGKFCKIISQWFITFFLTSTNNRGRFKNSRIRKYNLNILKESQFLIVFKISDMFRSKKR